MVARIINYVDFGGLFTDDYFVKYPELTQDWVLTDVLPNGEILPIWNGLNWVESYVEVVQVPKEISKMNLSIELFLLGITDQDIFDDIDSIPDVMFPQIEKQKAKIKYITAPKFERYNADLNLVATMEGLTQEQVDIIFINGNSI